MEQQATVRQRRTPPAGLGPMLNSARMRAGYRGRECARLAQLSKSYMFELECGTRCPSLAVARRLAEVLRLGEGERALLFASSVTDAGEDHPAKRVA
jgi:transcriptional regulator with XRE-family HTH domain